MKAMGPVIATVQNKLQEKETKRLKLQTKYQGKAQILLAIKTNNYPTLQTQSNNTKRFKI